MSKLERRIVMTSCSRLAKALPSTSLGLICYGRWAESTSWKNWVFICHINISYKWRNVSIYTGHVMFGRLYSLTRLARGRLAYTAPINTLIKQLQLVSRNHCSVLRTRSMHLLYFLPKYIALFSTRLVLRRWFSEQFRNRITRLDLSVGVPPPPGCIATFDPLLSHLIASILGGVCFLCKTWS
jgi:hypothetical protein